MLKHLIGGRVARNMTTVMSERAGLGHPASMPSRKQARVSLLDTLARARLLMEKTRFSCLPVLVDGRVAGLITLRDLRHFIHRHRENPAAAPGQGPLCVERLVRGPLRYLPPRARLGTALRALLEGSEEGIGVLQGDECAFVLSRDDLLEALLPLAERSDLNLADALQLSRGLDAALE